MDPTTLSILAIVIPSVIAVAAIIVSVVLYLKQKSKKELSYEIVSDASVVSVASKVSSKVQILFEGKLVEKTVRLVVVSLRNSGNQPVNREDFDDNKPIVFQFDTSKTKILDAEIVEPNLVGASLEKDPTLLAEGRLGLLPVLINQKE